MRVLLISANTEQSNMVVLPLGLAQLAAATEPAGHEVELLNLLQPGAPARRELGSFRPDVIGISVRNVDDQNMQAPRFLLEPVKEFVRSCREQCPGTPIVVGGAGYSIFPEAALAYLGADYGVRGEGEAVFPLLLGRIQHGQDVRDLPGVCRSARLPSGGGLGAGTPAVYERDMDRFPLPDPACWLAPASADSWVPVQSRRGCPLDCSYCSTSSIEGRHVRRRSPPLVADEIVRARAAGFRRFYFVDNTFNLPESYALRLCAELARRDLDIEWRCILYPRSISTALVLAMREAGCVEASIGFESGSEPILRAMNKRFGLQQVRAMCARLAGHGIRRNGFLLLGGPGETRRSIDESLGFADSLRLDTLKVTLGIRIYPDTSLHRAAIADGVVSPDDDLLLPRFYLARGLERVSGELKGRLG